MHPIKVIPYLDKLFTLEKKMYFSFLMQVNGVNDAFNNVLSEIDQGNIEGCFQKLLCEGAASPDTFAHILPILRSVELSTRLNLGSQATAVSRHLLEAIKFGAKQTPIGAAVCEQVYNACPWTGKQLYMYITEHSA